MKSLFRLSIVTALALVAVPALASPRKSAPAKDPVVLIKTSLGDIKIELDAKSSPLTVANFLKYVDESFYDGTIFHRVIASFMIQGGGFDKDMIEKQTHPPVVNESSKNGLKNIRGTIAMARTPDPNSATAQFFINVVDNPFLDYPAGGGGYAVFGKVISGMDVVDQIRAVPTGTRNGMGDVPNDPVVIKSIRRVRG